MHKSQTPDKTQELSLIPFSKPSLGGTEVRNIEQAIASGMLSGDHSFTRMCSNFLEQNLNTRRALLTTSGTHALELSALLCDIGPGDEVIVPSFTFSSTANAFALRGARLVFVDIRPDTLNIDEKQLEAAISPRTRAIVPVHYAGVSCEMSVILDVARQSKLFVVEDAAQGIGAKYDNLSLGAIGDFGCLSFHETKNITCGEGGALLINSESFILRAEILREKGTNRTQFFRGEVDKYNWQDIGSSYLLSDINAAFLFGQLQKIEEITSSRLAAWEAYKYNLTDLSLKGCIELPTIPSNCQHNAHIFYIKVRDKQERAELLKYLRSYKIMASFHYVPLHSSPAGQKYGVFSGIDVWTTKESERLLRLPLFRGISSEQVDRVCSVVKDFYSK